MSLAPWFRRFLPLPDFARRNARRLLLAYVLLFITLGFLTLPAYGFTWDEGVGDVFFGERYFHFFTSLNPAYLDFERPDLDVHQRPFNVYSSTYRDKPSEFLPVTNTISGMTMEVFGYWLRWLDPVDGFHFGKVLVSALLLWVLFQFTVPRLGLLAATFAVLLLSTYPRFWGDMHFNPLDIGAAVFSSLTIMAFYRWTERPSWGRAAAAGGLYGLALASKGTAHFVPVILFVGLFPWRDLPHITAAAVVHAKNYAGHYVLMLALTVIVFIGSWPYFYSDLGHVLTYYNFILTEGYTRGTATWNWDPFIQAVTTMPEINLLLLMVGIEFAMRGISRRESRLLPLLLAWLAIPIVRASIPGAANFDGIRHFEEFVPAACLLAAYGAAKLVAWGRRAFPRLASRSTQLAAALALVIIGNFGVIEARYFPYDYLYYNSLVGGFKGMQERIADTTDYWGGSYRQGLRWLNENAESEAQLHVAIAPWIVRLTAPIWLRSDISVIEEPVIKLKADQGYPVYAMFITRPDWYNTTAKEAASNLRPVHTVTVEGASVLVIYRLDGPGGIVSR